MAKCTFDHGEFVRGVGLFRNRLIFGLKHDLLPHSPIKVDRDIKKIPIDATFDIKFQIRYQNIIAPRNLEIAFENRFSFLPPGGSFLFRRKGIYEQTDFRNEIYAYKRTRNRLD